MLSGGTEHAYGGREHAQTVPDEKCLLCRIENLERERDTLDTAIASYAEASGLLIHSWPDDARERQRQSLYADVKFMQSALDAQADVIADLKAQRDEGSGP